MKSQNNVHRHESKLEICTFYLSLALELNLLLCEVLSFNRTLGHIKSSLGSAFMQCLKSL